MCKRRRRLIRQLLQERVGRANGCESGRALGQGSRIRGAARRSFDAKSVIAAGVIPSIRPACPMVRGRTVSSRARISLERPVKVR